MTTSTCVYVLAFFPERRLHVFFVYISTSRWRHCIIKQYGRNDLWKKIMRPGLIVTRAGCNRAHNFHNKHQAAALFRLLMRKNRPHIVSKIHGVPPSEKQIVNENHFLSGVSKFLCCKNICYQRGNIHSYVRLSQHQQTM